MEALSDCENTDASAKGQFRFQAKNLGLTYPRMLDIGPKAMAKSLREICDSKGLPLDKVVVGQELHKDGGFHHHAYLHFTKKIRTRDVRLFDLVHPMLGEFHPNWKKFRASKSDLSILKWIDYCRKDGNFVMEGFPVNHFVYKFHQGYTRNKTDLENWTRDAIKQGLRDAFPFRLPDGQIVEEPKRSQDGFYEKRRHWLIYGPQDLGKSYFFQKEFAGRKAYMRPTEQKNRNLFEALSYGNEAVIIYDDCNPLYNEMLDVSNVWELEKQVFGNSRYFPKYWKTGQARVMIWICNPSQLPDWARPSHNDYEKFKARFRFMEGMVWEGEPYFEEVEDTPTIGRVVKDHAGNAAWINE